MNFITTTKMTINQKSNVIGFILAVLVAIEPLLKKDGFNWQTDWINLVVAGLIAGLSYYIGKKTK